MQADFSAYEIDNDTRTLPEVCLAFAFGNVTFEERTAATYAMLCYLHGNLETQMAVAGTLTSVADLASDEIDTPALAMARRLCCWEGGADPYAAAFAGILLGQAVRDNETVKQLFVNVPLEVGEDGEPVRLLGRVTEALARAQAADSVMVQTAIFVFLVSFLDECTLAVQAFLAQPNHLSILVDAAMVPDSDLCAGLACLLLGLCAEHAEDEGATPPLFSPPFACPCVFLVLIFALEFNRAVLGLLVRD